MCFCFIDQVIAVQISISAYWKKYVFVMWSMGGYLRNKMTTQWIEVG
jgi:hypothetical protein